MRLSAIACQAFRCIDALELAPGPGINVIRGKNAQGKTSLLEAILYAATTKSHRAQSDKELVQHGSEGFRVAIEAERLDRTVRIEAATHGQAKRFWINGVPQHRLSELLGRIHVVFFCPEDLELIRGPGSVRRRFLDMELSQLDSRYLAALQAYREALRQRNELLRREPIEETLVAVYETQLADAAAVLVPARQAFVGELSEHATACYAALVDEEPLSVAYAPDVPDAADMGAVLERSRPSDQRAGLTRRGPHRDEIRLHIGGQEARVYGSQGQQKSAALALRLAELRSATARLGEAPILMLDEVLAELDADRARRLFGAITPDVQTFVTTTELTSHPGRFGSSAVNYEILGGRLERS